MRQYLQTTRPYASQQTPCHPAESSAHNLRAPLSSRYGLGEGSSCRPRSRPCANGCAIAAHLDKARTALIAPIASGTLGSAAGCAPQGSGPAWTTTVRIAGIIAPVPARWLKRSRPADYSRPDRPDLPTCPSSPAGASPSAMGCPMRGTSWRSSLPTTCSRVITPTRSTQEKRSGLPTCEDRTTGTRVCTESNDNA